MKPGVNGTFSARGEQIVKKVQAERTWSWLSIAKRSKGERGARGEQIVKKVQAEKAWSWLSIAKRSKGERGR